jgi:hypothetical protein
MKLRRQVVDQGLKKLDDGRLGDLVKIIQTSAISAGFGRFR